MSGILVGIDGSHHSTQALDWAMAEAALRKVPLTVVTVNPVPAGYWSHTPVVGPGDTARVAEIRAAAEKAVSEASAKLGADAPASVSVEAFSGFPAKALIEASTDYDLVVVGTRGGGGFASLALGSVSSQVVHHAHSPVVVVHTSG
jgi:nucleotide-binding universal stress UspA family protein